MNKLLLIVILHLVPVFMVRGQYVQITRNNQDEYHPCWHESGNYIAATTLIGNRIELWLYSVPDGAGRQISPTGMQGDFYASFVPGTDSLVFDAYDPVTGITCLWITDLFGQTFRKLYTFPAAIPAVSPDGQQIAYISDGHVFVKPLYGGTPQQLTFGAKNQVHPAWSPDGTRLAYVTEEGDDYNIRMIPSAGGTSTLLTSYSGYDDHPCWISGDELLFDTDRGGNWDIYRLNVNTCEATEFINETGRVCFPAILGSQNKLGYISVSSGQTEIWGGDLANRVNPPGSPGPVRVYPNPGKSFRVRFPVNRWGKVYLKVENTLGQTLIYSDLGCLSRGEHETSLTLPGNLPNGPQPLFLRVMNNEKEWVVKLMYKGE